MALAGWRAAAAVFSNETLKYKVEYKWGLVNKTAGFVDISLRDTGSRYAAKLTAKTAKWADDMYMVRDTLSCEIIKAGFQPVYYDKRSHEGGDDKHDHVKYTHSGNTVVGDCTRKKWKKGKLQRDETRRIEAQGVTVDMLSAFYYMRGLPYETFADGHKTVVNVFSGKRKEILTITYHGKETVKYDKKSYNTYHITFTFTSDGKKKTSDDMEAWIDTGTGRIPVKLEGKLPVGKVRCYYTGS